MHMLINALILAVFLPGAGTPPANTEAEPSCKAKLAGRLLTTTILFENGYGMEAPWQVMQTQRAFVSEAQSLLRVDLELDRIVEIDELTGERNTTALPQPVRVQIEGATDTDVVANAADTWCSSVAKVRGPETASTRVALPKPGRIT